MFCRDKQLTEPNRFIAGDLQAFLGVRCEGNGFRQVRSARLVQSLHHELLHRFDVDVRLAERVNRDAFFLVEDALEVIRLLDVTTIDLIDISGGTYFPGAKSTSDASGGGPYFLDFARRARARTRKPLMLTGGFKSREQAVEALESGSLDVVGVARGAVLDPRLARSWLNEAGQGPAFPRFEGAPPGGITAWYTMRLAALAQDREDHFALDVVSALRAYEERDAGRLESWRKKFGR